MAQDNSELRCALLSHSFAIRELNLYLDTHPNDTEALSEFRRLSLEFARLKDEYVLRGGIWCVTDAADPSHFEWINSPWPWEYKEGD